MIDCERPRFEIPCLVKITTFLLFCFWSILFGGCEEKNLNPAETIVRKSIIAHGGWEAWEKVRQVKYRKTILLFDSTGQLESKVIQFHSYQLKPLFTGEISWKVAEDTHRIVYDGEQAVKMINGQALEDSLASQNAYNSMMAAHYVLFQPFKLLDPGVVLRYEGRDTLEEGEVVDVVLASYNRDNSNHTKSDRWWYYFDASSNRLLANMVEHEANNSYIKNLDYDATNALLLNHHRKSYTVDSLRNLLFLRAEYFYDDIKLD